MKKDKTSVLGVFRVMVSVLKRDLEDYAKLENGWDGEGSLAPSEVAIKNAIIFAESLPLYVNLPTASITSNGDIILYWHNAKFHMDVNFHSDGSQSIYSTSNTAELCAEYGSLTLCIEAVLEFITMNKCFHLRIGRSRPLTEKQNVDRQTLENENPSRST